MMRDYISIDPLMSESKYRQIILSILNGISKGNIKRGDKLPSIGLLCRRYNLSRDTVMSAYNELKTKGIVISIPGKGYYIDRIDTNISHNIFLLFDELNAFKEELYTSFINALGDKGFSEVYFHHFNRKLFESLIRENSGRYTTYVIMPATFRDISNLLDSLTGKVIILDQLPDELKDTYPAVFQNFEKNVYQGLLNAKDKLKKYDKLIMVYPGGKEPEDEIIGFNRYCTETGTTCEIIEKTEGRKISKGEAYFAIWDSDLVQLIKQANARNFAIGKDIGIISYNDTALKEIVANGITTISTDFKEMGKTLANLVLGNTSGQIENPSALIGRGSL